MSWQGKKVILVVVDILSVFVGEFLLCIYSFELFYVFPFTFSPDKNL